MNYTITDKNDKDFIKLCVKLDTTLDNLSLGKDIAIEYNIANKLDGIDSVIVVYDGDFPAGCGSFKIMDNNAVEIKRVYVDESYRKQGIAREIMRRLEQLASQKGYTIACLETGRHMKPARTLYESIGYSVIPNYGVYKNIETSVCYEKLLK